MNDGGIMMVPKTIKQVFICMVSILLILFISGFAGEKPDIEKAYDISGEDVPQDIICTSDDGYLLVGYSGTRMNHARILYDFSVLKLDKQLNLVWKKVYPVGKIGSCKPSQVVETENGEFLVVGTKYVNFGRSHTDFILKLSATGQLLWHKSLGAERFSEMVSIIPFHSSSYLVFGRNYINNRTALWFLETNDAGILKIDNHLNGNRPEAKQMLKTSDGGFMIIGNDMTQNFKFSVFAIKFDSGYQKQWGQNLDFDLEAYALDMKDCFIIAGNSTQTKRLSLVKLNTGGKTDPKFKITPAADAEFVAIAPAEETEFYILNRLRKPQPDKSTPFSHLWVLRMNTSGKIVWEEKIEYRWKPFAFSGAKIVPADDDGLIVLYPDQKGDGDFGILKIDIR